MRENLKKTKKMEKEYILSDKTMNNIKEFGKMTLKTEISRLLKKLMEFVSKEDT
jgi:hypothetical protein